MSCYIKCRRELIAGTLRLFVKYEFYSEVSHGHLISNALRYITMTTCTCLLYEKLLVQENLTCVSSFGEAKMQKVENTKTC